MLIEKTNKMHSLTKKLECPDEITYVCTGKAEDAKFEHDHLTLGSN